ncbi:hypothetical protein BABINDRAFT_32966 [Babjeviella inositovora NRRL Y-12698]|uniref:Amino acid permease/ SLC12A domain-containing protein n=1 Tax=Babjeviella inositovora NRRL Y-12698 TaxID=984486 RepID=A0A1E3QX20_9ASCO|nr:uncharacterized protein BABINDRAFT_32966 [Babjeviella inositovora NRRL Y-12698]ODQ82141.1 hypothetical protein BABINDRAFT_32966 [Babjeviella inositovora NRRL Y-12698]
MSDRKDSPTKEAFIGNTSSSSGNDFSRPKTAANGLESYRSQLFSDLDSLDTVPDNRGKWQKFKDSFKPMNLNEDDGIDLSELSEMEKAVYATAKHPLQRSLKNRHLQMIAIGGSIGTGLFIGLGYALSQAGPAGTLIGFTLVGSSLYCVVQALGEMATCFPVSGAFSAFCSRFIDPSIGFVIGITYALSWLISLPSEIIACAITIQFWNSSIDPVAWVAIFFVAIVIINFFGVRGYGEAEFVFSMIKVVAVVGFIIVGIVIICGGGPQGGYIGGKYWHNPGAFHHGFKGVCSSFISAAFSFGGTEMAGLAAAETRNPRVAVPKATKQVFWRITIFYVVAVIIVGCLVPYTDNQLLSGTTSEDIAASPFVIAINNSGIKVLPHIMNAVILISVLSVGNSSVYGCSRTLAALAVQGQLPKIVGYIDRAGRPLVAIIITDTFGLLCFLVASGNSDTVFTWFFSVCSLASFFTWGMICLSHIRFRRALYVQNRGLEEVPFKAQLGVWGSYYGLLINFLLIMGEIWISVYPVGSSSASVTTFFQNCLSLPLVIVLYAGMKTYKGQWSFFYIKAKDMDIDTGRRELDIEVLKQEIAEERNRLKNSPLYYRIYLFWC